MMGNECRYCGARLRWERDDYTNRWVPLDLLPDSNGTFRTTPSGCLELGGMGRIHHHGLLYTRHSCSERKAALTR